MTERNLEQTIVIYRRWRAEPRTVVALFPTLIAYPDGLIESYEHIGQHGGADYGGVMRQTRPAAITEPDVQALHQELTRIGYNLAVRSRRGKG